MVQPPVRHEAVTWLPSGATVGTGHVWRALPTEMWSGCEAGLPCPTGQPARGLCSPVPPPHAGGLVGPAQAPWSGPLSAPATPDFTDQGSAPVSGFPARIESC